MKDLLLTDNVENIKDGFNKIILWNDFSSSPKKKIFSINNILENNKENFRKKFLRLAYIYKKKVWDKSKLNKIIDNDIETFYLSSIFNQSTFENNCLHFTLIKFLVLVSFLKKNKIKNLTFNIKNSDISYPIEKYCNSKNIKFNNIYENFFFINIDKSKIFKKLEYFYRIILIGKKIRFKKNITFNSQKDEIIFFDVLSHFNYTEANQGNFVSSYWGSLYRKILENNINTKWVHLFYSQKNYKNLSSANKLLNKINFKSKNNAHFILENFFSFKDLFNALKIYVKIIFKFFLNHKSIKIKNNSPFEGLNRLFRPYLIDTFIGYTSIRNIIFYLSIKNLIKEIKSPSLGLYIMENQTFEIILNNLWKRRFPTKLYGFPHSCVRFWDLRYFFIKPDAKKNNFPDKVCIHSKDTYEWVKYLKLSNEKYIDVESIRYENLIYQKKIQTKSILKNIIIYGDLDNEASISLCEIVKNKTNINFTFKNHPASSLKKEDLNYKNIKLTDDDLEIDQFDCVIATNGSGAVFKPYYSSFPFIIYLDPNFFNLSPINNLSKDIFFYDNVSFENCLNKIDQISLKNQKLHLIDKNCSRWIDVLKLNDLGPRFNFENQKNIL